MNYVCGLCGECECPSDLCELIEVASWNLSFGISPTREEYGDNYDTIMEVLFAEEEAI